MFSSIVSEARTHYIRLDRERNSLNEIIDLFKSTYTDQTNKFDRMKAFHALEQHTNQSVHEFAAKFDRIGYCTQETAKRPVKSIKEDDKISKLEECIGELEIALQRSTRPKTNCDYCKKLGHSADRCYKKKRDVVLKKTGSGN